MRKVILIVSAALFFVGGCVETEMEIFLNADGSGKVITDTRYSPMIAMQYSMVGEGAADSNAMIKEIVREMVENGNMLAWEGVDAGRTSEGGLFFKGTAYFEDIKGVSSGGSEMYLGGMGHPEIKHTDDGKMVLVLGDYDFEGEDENKDEKKKVELTDKEVEFKLQQMKMYLQQSKMMMGQYMGDFSYKMKIHLPGVIEDANVFRVVDERTVIFEIEGKQIMEGYDRFLADEAGLREMIKSGDEDMGMMGGSGKSMRKVMLGTDEPMRVVVVPDASMNVDYSRDIEAAKAHFKEMVEKFGIEYVEPVEVQIDPNNVPTIVHAEVIGAEVIHKSAIKDNEPGFRGRGMYDYDKPRYRMDIFVDFSCAVSEVKQIEITSVVDDKGKELVGDDRSSYPDYFSSDKTRVKFDISLEPPGEGASFIRSVQGVVTCVVSSKIEKAQLGFIELKNEAVLANGDVKIASMYKDEGFDPEEACSVAGQVSLEIANHGYRIHDVKLLAENGVELRAYMPCGGQMHSYGNKTDVTLEFHEVAPEAANIEVGRTKHFAEYELPFMIENVSLLGRALK